jgi:hypothetical protein
MGLVVLVGMLRADCDAQLFVELAIQRTGRGLTILDVTAR